MTRPSWDNQFRETEWERQVRWRRIKAKRIAAGRCPICAKVRAECVCAQACEAGGSPQIKNPDAHF